MGYGKETGPALSRGKRYKLPAFEDPGKTALEAYLERNFQFNLKLPRFAYMTGRSLSAFKRDFKEIYNTSPRKWLVQKRLDEAFFLLRKKTQTV